MSGFLGGLFGTEHKKPLPPPPLPKRNKSYKTRRNIVLSREARAKNAERLRKHRETMQTQLGEIDDYSNTAPPLPKRNKSYETRRNSVLSREARAKNAKSLRKHRETMQTQLGDIDDYSNTGAGATAQKRRRSLIDDMRQDMKENPFMGGKTRKRRRKRRRKTKRKGRRKTKKKRKRRKRKTRRKR
tara:strand:+ start:10589 stop:11146 length:558 start_codon:yes stop_codon:yes gene_type:complete